MNYHQTDVHKVLLHFARNAGKELRTADMIRDIGLSNSNLSCAINWLQRQGIAIVNMERGVWYYGVSELDLVS